MLSPSILLQKMIWCDLAIDRRGTFWRNIKVRISLGSNPGSQQYYLEKAGPYAGTYFENDLYGSTSYQCLPDFTVGGAECPEGAQNMNDCTIDDYARHGNFRFASFLCAWPYIFRWKLFEAVQLYIYLLQWVFRPFGIIWGQNGWFIICWLYM